MLCSRTAMHPLTREKKGFMRNLTVTLARKLRDLGFGTYEPPRVPPLYKPLQHMAYSSNMQCLKVMAAINHNAFWCPSQEDSSVGRLMTS